MRKPIWVVETARRREYKPGICHILRIYHKIAVVPVNISQVNPAS